LGYRDSEIDFQTVENKFKIMVVGDSFVSGHGIKNPKDRFSNLLQNKLNTNCKVFNLGKNGADTKTEYHQLVQFPLKPDLIVLAHYPNDIEHVARDLTSELVAHGILSNYKAGVLNISILNEILQHSYLINYFYWKFKAISKSRLEKQDRTGIEYYSKEKAKDQYLAFYLNESLLRKHLQNLYQFVLLSREESIPLVVILFPESWNSVIDYSGSSVNEPLEKFFSNQGVPVMNLYSLIKSIPLEKRIVNANDSHPSELTHQKVAEALLDFLAESKLKICMD
jgi:lysophospholipase L1-like esterase